ncbi:MAG: hypothetical protein GY830_02355 [Bacteroidetes bacterium]|nr:hypothetical protein [Bacteroidota bacterium]
MKKFNINLIILASLFIFFSCSGKNNFKGMQKNNHIPNNNKAANIANVNLSTRTTFKNIDDALAMYYDRLNTPNYKNDQGIGLFLNYIKNEELDDPELPIEKELGDDCDSTDCAYTWMNNNNNNNFPIPNYVDTTNLREEEFIFYILQYCYKHNQPPSDEYIKTVIVPDTGATVIPNNNPSNITPEHNSNDSYSNSEIVSAYRNQSMSYDEKELQNQYNESENEGIEGIPDEKNSTKGNTIIILKKEQFKPKYPARAHQNIYMPKEKITELRNIIDEEFSNDFILYYYTDISTALQLNGKHMNVFYLLDDDDEKRISIINYDLNKKGSSNETLYGVIVPNDDEKLTKDGKWEWKIDEFLDEKQIYNKYRIKKEELPQSSRKMASFQSQLAQQLVIKESVVDETDWLTLPQIKSIKKKNENIDEIPEITVSLSKELLIKEVKKCFSNVDLPLIPMVINKDNNHWIEWLKIIKIKSQNLNFGLSLRYYINDNKWKIEAMCLSREDALNKHRLVGLRLDEYNCQLKSLPKCIKEIKFKGHENNKIDEKIDILKKQINSQQDSIKRLKNSLLKAKKSQNNQCNNINSEIIYKDSENEISDIDNNYDEEKDGWLTEIVDDVIKTYDVLDFKTDPIGAKRNIYIDKQSTLNWINEITDNINDETNFYYWLDYTTAMQMVQKFSKQYINKKNGKFMLAIINYELKNENDKNLYGIIKEQENNKYPYKLEKLMTASEIKRDYGILYKDLPKKSRKNKEFKDKLLLKRKISKGDINKINWANLKLFKSEKNQNSVQNKSVTITQKVMKEYVNIALEKLNKQNRGNYNLIPIVFIDKYNSYYGIEWILIVNIIHRNCDVGISFKYDEKADTFIATAIYLDKEGIKSKHKLIGLKYDYCKNLRPFSLRKFKFKSMSDSQGSERYKKEINDYKNKIDNLNRMVQEQYNNNDIGFWFTTVPNKFKDIFSGLGLNQ